MTGVVDMEVASAGDPIEDLLKFSLELAPILPARTRWWQALFDGYGQEPEYALFRLRMLGCSPEEFACVRPCRSAAWGESCGTSWPPTRGRTCSPMAGESRRTRAGRPISDEPRSAQQFVFFRVREGWARSADVASRAPRSDCTSSVGKRRARCPWMGPTLRLAWCK